MGVGEEVHLQRALLTQIVDSQRNVMFDVCRQLNCSEVNRDLTFNSQSKNLSLMIVEVFGSSFRRLFVNSPGSDHGFPHRTLSRRTRLILPDGFSTRMS